MNSIPPAKRHSITFRMTLAVCVFLILFQAALATMIYFYFKREFKHSISDQQFTLLTVVSQNIDQKLLSSQRVIVEVSRLITPEILNDTAAAQSFLDSRPGTHSLFDNGLFLFSPEGKLIAEAPYRPNRRGRDISFREYFKKTLATGLPVISEPYLSTHTPGAPAVIFTAPVRDRGGKLVAILGGSLNLLHDNFLGELSRISIAETGYLYICTHDRTMIMHPDRSRIMEIAAFPGVNQLLDRALNGFEGTEENVNSQGIKSLTSIKHLQVTDWIIAANYPLDEAYAPIRHAQKILQAIIFIGAVLVIVVVRAVMERFTRDLVRFAQHVQTISSKQGEDRLYTKATSDEIGILAQTFNTMIRHEDQKSEELVYASTHDALTGLFNRAYFDSELERLARGRQTPISVVVADVDGLKRCNDTLGHLAGDDLIRAAARVLLESFRAEDIVARIGGDEFGVLLPGMGTEQVEMSLERVRNSEAKVAPVDGVCLLSISLGYATSETPEGLQETFKQADRQMYLEKAARQHSIA